MIMDSHLKGVLAMDMSPNGSVDWTVTNVSFVERFKVSLIGGSKSP